MIKEITILYRLFFVFYVVILFCLSGCSTTRQLKAVDKEAYDIITLKSERVRGTEPDFMLEPETRPEIEGQRIISLDDALDFAVNYNRDYRRRREDVYIEALDLGYERYKWGVRYYGLLSGDFTEDLETDEESIAAQSNFSISKIFATGARLSLDLTSDFFQYLTGNSRKSAASILAARLTQPLFQGAGKSIAQENLKQSERDMVYRLRDFARYRKIFSISIASGYYRVLQQRDAMENAWKNYQNLIVTYDRAKAMARAGKVPEFEVDQASQQMLKAKDGYIRAKQGYEQQLDNYRISLGLSPDASIEPDPQVMKFLTEDGLKHPAIKIEDAVNFAFENRLDLLTARDSVDDAERKLDVAKDNMNFPIDLFASYDASSEEDRLTGLAWQKGEFSTGFDRIELPLDKRLELNDLRKAQINLDEAKRSYYELRENIIREVRQAWRDLQQARESYIIQHSSLELAERRVESTTLFLQAGRAITRDLLEAQEALLDAQNNLTRALVAHNISRLVLWRDMGTLEIEENGKWKEPTEGDEG